MFVHFVGSFFLILPYLLYSSWLLLFCRVFVLLYGRRLLLAFYLFQDLLESVFVYTYLTISVYFYSVSKLLTQFPMMPPPPALVIGGSDYIKTTRHSHICCSSLLLSLLRTFTAALLLFSLSVTNWRPFLNNETSAFVRACKTNVLRVIPAETALSHQWPTVFVDLTPHVYRGPSISTNATSSLPARCECDSPFQSRAHVCNFVPDQSVRLASRCSKHLFITSWSCSAYDQDKSRC
jgi:hypothetical protein